MWSGAIQLKGEVELIRNRLTVVERAEDQSHVALIKENERVEKENEELKEKNKILNESLMINEDEKWVLKINLDQKQHELQVANAI